MMRRRMLLGGIAGLCLATGARAEAAAGPEAAVRAFAATLSAHDMAGFAALFAEDYAQHQWSAASPPPPPGLSPRQGTIGFFTARLLGLPDLSVRVETVLASEAMAAASFLYEGTHTGPLMGVAPTGRRVRFGSTDIFRVRDGKFVEHWGMGDLAGLMAQLKGA